MISDKQTNNLYLARLKLKKEKQERVYKLLTLIKGTMSTREIHKKAIQNDLDFSYKTIQRYLKQLQEKNLIEIVKKFNEGIFGLTSRIRRIQ